MNEKVCRAIVKERSDGLCERCGSGAPTTMHHRKKRSQGGAWTPANIVAVCGHGTVGCHGWIEHNPSGAADEGFHVRPWEDPAEILVLTWRGLTRLTVDSTTYSEPIDMQDHWFPTNPE